MARRVGRSQTRSNRVDYFVLLHALVFVAAVAASVPSPHRWRATAAFLSPGLEPPARAWSPPLTWAGRIVTREQVHIGIRSHWLVTGDEKAGAVTVQITVSVLP